MPEKRKNFFLVLAYYHHTIESPGTAGQNSHSHPSAAWLLLLSGDGITLRSREDTLCKQCGCQCVLHAENRMIGEDPRAMVVRLLLTGCGFRKSGAALVMFAVICGASAQHPTPQEAGAGLRLPAPQPAPTPLPGHWAAHAGDALRWPPRARPRRGPPGTRG